MEKIKLIYSLTADERMESYDLYRRLYKRKFTIIKAALFLIPLILFIQQIWIDPYYTLGYLCAAVCVGAIACILMTPKMERNSVERTAKVLKDDKYEMSVSEDGKIMTVSTVLPESDEKFLDVDKDGNNIPEPKIPPTKVDLSEKGVKCVETEKVFSVMSKEICLAIPKGGLSVYEIETLRDCLRAEKG